MSRTTFVSPQGERDHKKNTTWARSCGFYGSHAATLAKSYKIGKISALKDLDNELAIDDPSDVCVRLHC